MPDNVNFTVSGRITDRLNQPAAGLIVRAMDTDPVSPDDFLGEAITDADGGYSIRFTSEQFTVSGRERTRPDIYIRVFSGSKPLGESTVRGNADTDTVIDLQVDDIETAHAGKWLVAGRVDIYDLRSLSQLRVQAVDKNIGGQDIKLGDGEIDARGSYTIYYDPPDPSSKEKPDVQVQLLKKPRGRKPLTVSAVRYDAGSVERGLNVAIARDQVDSIVEYNSLVGELRSLIKHTDEADLKGKLANLKEDDDQQDITYLASKIRWDARTVAMTSLANQFGQADDGIEPEFYYALFRAGIPANKRSLSQVNPETAKSIWKGAIESGVIATDFENDAELEEKLKERLEKLKNQSASSLLEEASQVGISNFKDIIGTVVEDDAKQIQLAQLYYDKRDDLPTFWANVENEFPDEKDRLVFNSQLASLTINNVPLITKLQAAENDDLATPFDLIAKGYHQPSKWRVLFDSELPIPDEIPGHGASSYFW